MEFIKLGNKYYNTALIGWAISAQIDEETRYFVQFVGGFQLEVTEEEYQTVCSSGDKASGNGVFGSIEGTYDIGEELNTLVNISNGKILNIFVKDGNEYKDIQEFTTSINQDLKRLEQIVGTGEDFVGTITRSYAPDTSEMTTYVQQIRGEGYPKGGNSIIWIYEVSGGTDRVYKYIYNGNAWIGYEIPVLELASNGSPGILKGTFNVNSNNSTIVDIASGEILAIYIKDGNNLKNIESFITDISNIVSGATQVGNALKATQDESGNNIKSSYGSSLTASDATVTLKNKNGETLSQATVNNVGNASYATSAGSATNDKNGNDIVNTYLTKSDGATKNYVDTADSGLSSRIDTIDGLIPTEASSINKLADKDYVNDTMNSLLAYYITRDAQGDPFRTKTELDSATIFYSGGVVRVPTQNDYLFVQCDESQSTVVSGYSSFTTTDQYIGYYVVYNYSSTLVTDFNKDSIGIVLGTTIAYIEIPSTRYIRSANNTWEFQFIVNSTGFNTTQMASINSGINASLVNKLNGIETGAQVNVIETIKDQDGNALPIVGKSVTLPGIEILRL